MLTSVYHTQSNSKVERFHRTLHDVLSKKLEGDPQFWDLNLQQSLASIRFCISTTTQFSPFFLLYNRDVVLPIDNLMKPRRKYQGQDLHQIILQEQHKAFQMVRRNLKKAKKRQAKYADRNSKEIDFQINDPVYYKNNRKTGKLDIKWKPYYRIIEKVGPVTYVIKNQLDGSTSKVHAELLRLANIDDWEIPQTDDGRPMRKAAYVIPPEDSDSDSTDSDNEPLLKLAKRVRLERDNSESEDNIPLMELARRIKSSNQPDDQLGNQNLHNEPQFEPSPGLIQKCPVIMNQMIV